MDASTAVQFARELDKLRKDFEDLNEKLQPVFKREERLQRKEELDKKYPYGWEYRDPDHPEKGLIIY